MNIKTTKPNPNFIMADKVVPGMRIEHLSDTFTVAAEPEIVPGLRRQSVRIPLTNGETLTVMMGALVKRA